MINKSKNVCYVIYGCYEKDGEDCRVKFLSQHSVSSNRFKEFANAYYDSVLKVSRRNRTNSEDTAFEQYTISRKDWLDQKIRINVLKGITEQEKCY